MFRFRAGRKIKYKDTDGNVINDPEMTKLAKQFFESISQKESRTDASICE